MSISLSTTAPITPAPVETNTDSAWVMSDVTDGSSKSAASIKATYVLLPYLANNGNPIFADASAAITIKTSSVAAMASHIPAVAALLAGKVAAVNAIIAWYLARKADLATATSRQTTAQSILDTAKTSAAAALKTLTDAQAVARAAGVNGVNDPTYIAAHAACIAAKPLADSTVAAQVAAQNAMDAATSLVTTAQAAVNDLALPPVVLS